MARISMHVSEQVKEWVAAKAEAEKLSDSKYASRIVERAFDADQPQTWNPTRVNTVKGKRNGQ